MKTKLFCSVVCIFSLLITLAMFVSSPSAKADDTIADDNILPVEIDIKPGSCPNSLNVNSKGVLPVAVLGAQDFDVETIDPETIRLTVEGSEKDVLPIRWNYDDVATPFDGELCDCHEFRGDGIMDLTLKFDTQELVEMLELDGFAGETIALIISGECDDGAFEGRDCVRVLEHARFDPKKMILTIPEVYVGEELMYKNVEMKQRGNSNNFELISAEPVTEEPTTDSDNHTQ